MTPTEAAAIWKQHKPAAKEHQAQVDKAEKVLKEHFRKSGRTTYRGIAYLASTYDALDAGLARELLGRKADQATVTRTRETLTALG